MEVPLGSRLLARERRAVWAVDVQEEADGDGAGWEGEQPDLQTEFERE